MACKKRGKIQLFHTSKGIITLTFVLVVFVMSISFLQQYQNPNLEGKWLSKETGEIVQFKKNGTVVLENSTQKPTYKLISPERMEYNVDNKTFLMHYVIKGRNLTWGINNDTMENFKRK